MSRPTPPYIHVMATLHASSSHGSTGHVAVRSLKAAREAAVIDLLAGSWAALLGD